MDIVKGFSKFSRKEKERYIQHNFQLERELNELTKRFRHPTEQTLFDEFSENTLSNYYLPYGVAPNFLINGKMYVIPMVTEESSVVAAASRAASFWAHQGGFKTSIHDTIKVGHIWFEWKGSENKILHHKERLITYLEKSVEDITHRMKQRGGGIVDMQFVKEHNMQNVWQLKVKFKTADSMGANFINTTLEAMKKPLSNFFEVNNLKPIDIIMAILSNYTPDCLITCEVSCNINKLKPFAKNLSIEKFVQRFKQAIDIAHYNIDRATTHNKGIYNGVDAVMLATGNDFRAVEAAGHAYACKDGQYRSLSKCSIKNNQFKMSLTLPLAVGTVGGITHLHPLASLSLDILQKPSATELMSIATSVGLANNFAAVSSLVTSGIQKGHMKLHLSNILTSLNATNEQREQAVHYFADKTVSTHKVREFLKRGKVEE